MKGEIKMENTHSTFLVLKISEDKDNGNTDISLIKALIIFADAKNYKDAKDLIERLSPRNIGDTLNIKFNKFFTSPLFKTKKNLGKI